MRPGSMGHSGTYLLSLVDSLGKGAVTLKELGVIPPDQGIIRITSEGGLVDIDHIHQ